MRLSPLPLLASYGRQQRREPTTTMEKVMNKIKLQRVFEFSAINCIPFIGGGDHVGSSSYREPEFIEPNEDEIEFVSLQRWNDRSDCFVAESFEESATIEAIAAEYEHLEEGEEYAKSKAEELLNSATRRFKNRVIFADSALDEFDLSDMDDGAYCLVKFQKEYFVLA